MIREHRAARRACCRSHGGKALKRGNVTGGTGKRLFALCSLLGMSIMSMARALHGACDLETLALDSLTAQQFSALRKTKPFLLTDAAGVWAGWPGGAAFSAAFSGLDLPLRNATALAQHGSAGATSSRADVGAYAAVAEF